MVCQCLRWFLLRCCLRWLSSVFPEFGTEGEEIRIIGTGFSPVKMYNSVVFVGTDDGGSDDVPAVISSSSSTELIVEVPSAAVTGPVEVEVEGVSSLSSVFTVTIDRDTDNDGLIDVTSLDQLSSLRFDLNGDGLIDSNLSMLDSVFYETSFGLLRKSGVSCTDGCRGYELTTNLDFEDANGDETADDKSVWAEDAVSESVANAVVGGWLPIGDNSSTDARYSAVFDGNDYVVSNLYVDRTSADYVGLFGYLGSSARVRNVGLVEGSVSAGLHVGCLVGYNDGAVVQNCYTTGDATTTKSSSNVGALVGSNDSGTIVSCYTTGSVSSTQSVSSVGGLVGHNNGGKILACYTTASSSGRVANSVGALVGSNDGTIAACYTTGEAEGRSNSNVGGLVGSNNGGTITACYSTANASITTGSSTNIGGLVGYRGSGVVTDSYFDYEVSNRLAIDFYSSTTSALQSRTSYTGIYLDWDVDVDDGLDIGVQDGKTIGDNSSDDPWEFGSSSDYPLLSVDFDRDGTSTVYEFGGQGQSVPSLGITSISPTNGPVGTIVEIEGTGFSSTETENTVTFLGELGNTDDQEANITFAGTTLLEVEVPNNAISGQIQVKVGTEMITSSQLFTVLTLLDVEPTSSSVGESIKIAGSGFSMDETEDSVSFDRGTTYVVASSFISGSNADTIVVEVPDGAEKGTLLVKVLDGEASELAQIFTIVPTIVGIDPVLGPVSTAVTITGTGFSLTESNNSVTFLGSSSNGDERVAIISSVNSTATELIVSVPDGAVSGAVEVSVNGEVVQTEVFTIVPTIVNVLPISGEVGESIKIAGSGFSMDETEDSVSFDRGTTYVVASSFISGSNADTIVVEVPDGAEKGTLLVKVLDGEASESAQIFTIVPTIVGIDPVLGPVSTAVTITGTGFSLTESNNSVTFLGSSSNGDERVAIITSVDGTATELVVSVPVGAVSGPIEVDVNGEVVQTVFFTVIVDRDTDNDGLIDVTNLEQLDAIRFDLNGDGMIDESVSMSDSISYEMAFSIGRRGVVSCTDGCRGYGLMTSLDFEDADGSGPGTDKSRWAEGANLDGVSGAIIEGWLPVGDNSSPFTGTFAGNDNTISNLYIDRSSTSNVGLFGYLGSTAEIRSVGVEEGSVEGSQNVGALVGDNRGTIITSHSTTGVTGRSSVGGLVGENRGTIRDCYATENVAATVGDAGGLVGYSNGGTIIDCNATGSATGTENAGALVGDNRGQVRGSYATGDANGDENAGGLLGRNTSIVSNSYATGNSTSTAEYSNAGGLVGENNGGTIVSCYATGDALSTGDENSSAGLVGWSPSGSIVACYATGNSRATGNDSDVGGLVGVNSGVVSTCYATGDATGGLNAAGLVGVNSGTISTCYARGNAEAEGASSSSGGLVGSRLSGIITDSYFDVWVSSSTQGVGNEVATDPPLYARTTYELQDPLVYDNDVDNANGSSIYEGWDVDVDNGLSVGVDNSTLVGDPEVDAPWDFGTELEYPALKVDFDRSGSATALEFGTQLRVAPLNVVRIFPNSGSESAEFRIIGSGFSTTPSGNEVSFVGTDDSGVDDKVVMLSSSDSREIVVEVPVGSISGPISVSVSGESAVSSEVFTVLSTSVLAITGISPNRGSESTEVSISGQNFGSTASANVVTFLGASGTGDDQEADITNASSTELVVEVPVGAVSGPIEVDVVGVSSVESSEVFTVLPSITDIDPSSGYSR